MDKVKKVIKKLILRYYKILLKILPVKQKTIVFQSSLGRNYSGNPKAIYEQMVQEGLDWQYRCYYILNDPASIKLPGRIKKIKNSRMRYYYVMASAGIWISDTRFQNYIVKREETIYVQTWHGTPLKKLALDMDKVSMAENVSIMTYQAEFCKNSATWDYLIVQNEYSEDIFKRAFQFEGTILRTGYPRNDVLFSGNNRESINELKARYDIPEKKKVMLYAPTWRDDAYYDKENYKFVTGLDFERLKERFEKEYIFMIKYHYMVNDKTDWDEYGGFVRLAPAWADISELYLLSDLLITDYSSVMFDYSILKRPMFFYVHDYDSYKEDLRGFYFDLLEEAPGPVVFETTELIQAIRQYETWEFSKAYEVFSEKYHMYDNGTASLQVIDVLRN